MNFLVLVFTGLTLIACVQVSPVAKQNINKLAISSVRDLPTRYAQGSFFSLSPRYIEETSLKPEQTQAAYQFYANAIIHDLQQNGFEVANNHKSAFHVGFGVALSDDLSDEKINEKFGVSPGLPQVDDFKKGSVLIYIEDANTGQKVWRGIAQGFAHESLNTEQRKKRTAMVVASVMKQFYQTN